MTTIDLTHTFCAHECNPLGQQALTILKRFGAQTTLTLFGGDPATPRGSVLFLATPAGVCKSSFLRAHPQCPTHSYDLERQQFLESHLQWARMSQVVFINPQFAKRDGLFGGKPLNGFTFALAGLVGYVSPATIANRARKKRRWLDGPVRHESRNPYFC